MVAFNYESIPWHMTFAKNPHTLLHLLSVSWMVETPLLPCPNPTWGRAGEAKFVLSLWDWSFSAQAGNSVIS
jgi:hypothetical protein